MTSRQVISSARTYVPAILGATTAILGGASVVHAQAPDLPAPTTTVATTTAPTTPAPSRPAPGPTPAPGAGTAAAPTTLSLQLRSDERLRFGDRVKLTGRHSSRKRDKLVKIEYEARGEKPTTVARARTDKKGRFVVRDRPPYAGRYRAIDREGSLKSERVSVAVAPTLSFEAEDDTLAGRKVDLSGELLPAARGRRLVIESRREGDWKRIERVDTGKPFATSWRPERAGSYKLRASFAGDERNSAAREAEPLTAFRESVTSFYGPGFFGRRTACGKTLQRETIGVAHKEIRCGKKVTFQRKGRTITVPVIDRGPFVKGREWDLTAAAASKLKIKGVEKIWASR